MSETAFPPASAAAHDLCVVMNAGSGKRRADDAAKELETLLAEHAGRVSVRLVRKGGDLTGTTDEAVAEGFRTIVAAGGDGTINAVASRIVGKGPRLGVIPLGTFNYVARALGLPESVEGAVKVILAGHDRPLPVGEVNGRVFLNNASLGVYPAILQERERIYKRYGRSRLAAHWSVLLTLADFRKPLKLRLTVDGRAVERRTPLVFVANNGFQLDQFGLEGGDCLESGRFAVFLAPDIGRLAMIRLALGLAAGRLSAGEDFELQCGSEIMVDTRRGRRIVARDGERERMTGPFTFRRRMDALRVLAPRPDPSEGEPVP